MLITVITLMIYASTTLRKNSVYFRCNRWSCQGFGSTNSGGGCCNIDPTKDNLADRLNGKNAKVNAVHPASLKNTKMVFGYWDKVLTTIEQGAKEVGSVILSEIKGEFYNGKTYG
jgi:hypothetical protein